MVATVCPCVVEIYNYAEGAFDVFKEVIFSLKVFPLWYS